MWDSMFHIKLGKFMQHFSLERNIWSYSFYVQILFGVRDNITKWCPCYHELNWNFITIFMSSFQSHSTISLL